MSDRLNWLGDIIFFFSSRRRHTRWTGDWSSDVCSSDLVVNVPGGFQVVGVPQRRVTWKEVASAAYAGGQALPAGETPGLEASTYFQPEGEVWSFGAVVCAVRVEGETGRLSIERLVWVDDAGTAVKPLLAEGQLHGALAQGLGQALLEAIVYDRDGQLLTGTLMA